MSWLLYAAVGGTGLFLGRRAAQREAAPVGAEGSAEAGDPIFASAVAQSAFDSFTALTGHFGDFVDSTVGEFGIDIPSVPFADAGAKKAGGCGCGCGGV